jgi:eukaryotic-like serine/threonine-protein kinase
MPSKPLEPGDPASIGRFELLGRLGEGGQGVVYLGLAKPRGGSGGSSPPERVAIKVLRSSVDATVLERLGRELDAVHQVQPFVTARFIEASADGDLRYIVSEFIDGPSLADRVAARGPLPEGDLQRLAVGTATALTAIHGAGVVHRDFKPANVLLGPDGPRVVDFGIARLTDAATITTSGVIGTPSYMAPEQLSGERPTSAVDIFAWAATMVFAATGRAAFGADAVPAVMQRILFAEPDLAGVPAAILPVIRQCLDKDPGRRPSARDLLLRLVDPSLRQPAVTSVNGPRREPAQQGPDAPAEPSVTYATMMPSSPLPTLTPAPVPGRLPRRRPVVAVVTAAAVVAAAAIAVPLLLISGPPANPSPAKSSTGQPSTGQHSTGRSSAGQAAGGTIPAAFAGSWSGTATLSAISNPAMGISNPITFTFTAGGRTVHEVDQDCVNTLTLTIATSSELTFSEPQTGNCVAGTDTFTLSGADLLYHWRDNVGLEQNSATLHRAAQ